MFKDKIVLITGASRGIGRATAIEFGKLHATIIVNFRNNEKAAKEVVDEIVANGGSGVICKADLSKIEDIEKVVSFVKKNFGRLDILINNAGIVFDRDFFEIKYEESLEILKTNMLAPLFLSQKLAPIMMESGGGKIVNVSSTSGMHDFCPGTADYAMSKLALQSLTKDLSMQFAPKILVNAVAPGWVDTDMNADLPQDFVESETSKYHMKRWASPQEIANAIVFLASEKASYITGHILVADGGHC